MKISRPCHCKNSTHWAPKNSIKNIPWLSLSSFTMTVQWELSSSFSQISLAFLVPYSLYILSAIDRPSSLELLALFFHVFCKKSPAAGLACLLLKNFLISLISPFEFKTNRSPRFNAWSPSLARPPAKIPSNCAKNSSNYSHKKRSLYKNPTLVQKVFSSGVPVNLFFSVFVTVLW